MAHVDSPKGDLNSDGIVSGPLTTVLTGSEVYPWGTTEQYPNADANEGHFYMECSNKGLCNRKTGVCECFDGYTGTACAKAACPNDCSGHGTCESIREFANMRHFDTVANHAETSRVSGSSSHHHYDGNVEESYSYDLWDADKSMGCKCDPGYWSADCSQRKCAYGVDPLFYDNEGAQLQTTVVHLGSTGTGRGAIGGSFKIVFYDVFGEQYVTKAIDASPTTASAEKVRLALHALPNQVIANKPNRDVTSLEPNNVKISMQSASGSPGTADFATYGGGAEGDSGSGLGTQGAVTADACSGGAAGDNCPTETTIAGCQAKACTGGTAAGCSGAGSDKCTWTTATHAAYGIEFTVEFTNNPGVMRSMEIDTQQVNNPGDADYWVANYREGQFTTRFATTLGRVNTLMYGSKLLYTNNDNAATNLAPVNAVVQIGGSQYRVTAAQSYFLTLAEPWLGASILPILIDTGAVATAFVLTQPSGSCAGGNGAQCSGVSGGNLQATCTAASCTGGTGAGCSGTGDAYCTWTQTGTVALDPQQMTVSGVSTEVITSHLMAGSQLQANDCPFISEQGGTPSNDIALGETALYVATGNDCHSFSSASHVIYRRNDDDSNMHLYATGVDTGAAASQTVIAQRGSPDIYFAGALMDNTAAPNTAQQYIASFVASTKTFTFKTASKGAASAANTLHWVNGLGPMKAAAVSDGASTIVMDPDAAKFFDTDFSTANTQFPIYKEISGTDAGITAGSILLLNGRRYKVSSRSGSKVTLNENVAGGELRRLCTACVNTVTAAGTSIALVATKKVTLAAGDRVLVGGLLNEDLQATVTTALTDGTTIAVSAGTFRGTPANVAGQSADVDYSASPRDLYVLSNGVLQTPSVVTEGVATTFQYVGQCSNRGFCNGETGLCECYAGYSNHNCDTQNMLAM